MHLFRKNQGACTNVEAILYVKNISNYNEYDQEAVCSWIFVSLFCPESG